MLPPWMSLDFLPLWSIFALSVGLVLSSVIFIGSIWTLPFALGGSFYALKAFAWQLRPETAVLVLAFILIAKLCEKNKNLKTHYILGFLWVGSFALFNNSTLYLIFLLCFLSITFLIMGKKEEAYFSFSLLKFDKRNLKTVLITIPTIALLFFIFPRFSGFIPRSVGAVKGKVGYAKEINNSSTANLELNGQNAFYASLDKQLPSKLLYWRGRVLERTDGYNWSSDKRLLAKSPVTLSGDKVQYSINLQQDFEGDVILLDVPSHIKKGDLRSFERGKTKSFQFYIKKRKASYEAESFYLSPIKQKLNKKKFLELPSFTPRSLLSIYEKTKHENIQTFISNIERFLQDNQFKYSLSPGPMPTMKDFIERKAGFCTHYASLVGILLRLHQVPSRLISGFQGGEFNQFGNFYQITSNDAHAWVEYYDNGFWKRLDPTEFVAPSRIQRGGQDFFAQGLVSNQSAGFFGKSFYRLSQYFQNLDFKITSFFDNYNRDEQYAFAKKLKINLKTFYYIGGALFCLFLVLVFYIFKKAKQNPLRPEDILFKKFEIKCTKRGINIEPYDTENIILEKLKSQSLPESYIQFVQCYIDLKYRGKDRLSTLKTTFSAL